MTARNSKTAPRRNCWRKALPILVLGAAALLPLEQTQAAMPVVDWTHIGNDLLDWAQNLQEWMQELNSWKTQISSLGSLVNGLNISGSSLQTISDADKVTLVNQSCPGPSLLSAQGLAQMLTTALNANAGLTGNIQQSQQNICQQIVLLQVDKYNRTVAMLGRINGYGNTLAQLQNTLNTVDAALKGITALTSGGSISQSIADLTSQMNSAQQNRSGLDAEMKAYQASISADDAAISSLQMMQSNLGKVALHGSPSLLGQVIQAGAFAAAFN
jgi:prefoldin subunit 5